MAKLTERITELTESDDEIIYHWQQDKTLEDTGYNKEVKIYYVVPVHEDGYLKPLTFGATGFRYITNAGRHASKISDKEDSLKAVVTAKGVGPDEVKGSDKKGKFTYIGSENTKLNARHLYDSNGKKLRPPKNLKTKKEKEGYDQTTQDLEDFEKSLEPGKIEKFDISNLTKIGEGSGRKVYDLGRSVLKVSKFKGGTQQNQYEYAVWKGATNKKLLAPITDNHKKMWWIVQDKARQISEKDLMSKLDLTYQRGGNKVNITFDQLGNYLLSEIGTSGYFKTGYVPSSAESVMRDHWWVSSLIKLSKKFELDGMEFTRIDSYGQISGEPVLIDYGMTKYVQKRYFTT